MPRFNEWVMDVFDKSRLHNRERLAMLCIASYANEEGIATPGLATIASDCNVSIRDLPRILARIETSGELEITHGRGRRSNTYRILLGPNAPAAVVRNDRTPEPDDDLPDDVVEEAPKPVASWPYTITHAMVIEDSIDWEFLGPDLERWFAEEGYMPRNDSERWEIASARSLPQLRVRQ